MKPFTVHTGIVAAMDRANVDTDQIIPKQFLKSIKRTGFGVSLFFDWRYEADGNTPDPAFELNAPAFAGAQVLVTGDVKHHDARAAHERGLGIVDPGHAASEGPGVASLYAAVAREVPEALDLTGIDPDPWLRNGA